MPEPSEHPRLSVNHLFFRSPRIGRPCCGLVLSGTGMDGTEESRPSRTTAASPLAQDPRTARYGGMPESAIATGYADLILPPEAMGKELVRYMRLREGTSAGNRPCPRGSACTG